MGIFKFDEIAFNSTEKKKPVDEDKYTYLGLEHLDSDSIYVTRYGADVAPKGDKLIMKKGDVLFGKRRAYQKKVAIAPFDGIFSAHGMVLRPKEDVIDKDFFPMFIKSDYFLDAAIKISVGSLSPTINWRDLKELKFELPSLEEQRKLAEVLWAIYDMNDKYKKLILATDELVKSQFIEMFGDPQTNDKDLPVMRINEVVSLLRNGATIKQNKDRKGYPITRIETIANRTVDRSRMGYAGITDLSKYEDYILQDGDILMSHINSVTHMGKSAIYEKNADENIIHGMNLLCLRPKVNIVIPYFLYRYFQMDYFYEQVLSITKKAVNQASMTIKDLGNLTLIVPDMESQMLYVDLVRQSDKSKFALQEAIKDLDALSKKIIAENLIPAGKE